MTQGHTHHVLKIKDPNARWVKWLRKPRRFSDDRVAVEDSIFAWGIYKHGVGGHTVYSLSLLGILHGLTGLTLYWEDPEDGTDSGNVEPN